MWARDVIWERMGLFDGPGLVRIKGLLKHLEFKYADAFYSSQTAASQPETVVIIPGENWFVL